MKKVKISITITLILIAALALYFPFQYRTIQNSPFIEYAKCIPKTFRVGFTNLDKEVSIPSLEVKGNMPKWLSGTLFRNGPAKFTAGSTFISNWFDGLAMIHAFSFHDGMVSYANKFLRTTDYETVKESGKMSYGGFVSDPCKSIFKRLFSYFWSAKPTHPKVQNANVNIVKFTSNYTALTETPLPVEFDPKTLDTLGVMTYNDSYPKSSIHESAHPHYDHTRAEHISYLVKFGRQCFYEIYRIKDGTTTREVIASIEVDRPSYMHSFAITKNYAILSAIPLVVNPLDLKLRNQAFIKNFKWKPENGTHFIVVDRIHKKFVGSFKGEPFFMFHNVNAFEDGKKIHLDIITYKDSSTIGQSTFDKILDPSYHPAKQDDYMELKRFSIDLGSKAVASKKLSNTLIELPRINYEKYNGKDYSYVYGESKLSGEIPYVATQIVKINVKNGETKIWREKECYPGEPVFVANPKAKAEDDGVILSIVLDARKEKSFLLVLDAKTFKEIARAEVPHHIPFGIHGAYIEK